MKATRVNQNSKVVRHKTKTMNGKALKCHNNVTILCGFVATSDALHIPEVI